MLKNKHNNYQNFSYSLKEDFDKSDKSICLLVKDNNEAIYVNNELSLLMESEKILVFPENDILPYDHFSIPEQITKERFKIINANQNKHILVTSIKNLFDLYPRKENFQSMGEFSIGKKISLANLLKVVESLNYMKKANVEKINEYSVRGGIVDIYTPLYSNPLRIEIFDDILESIRFFDVDTQLSIDKIKSFSLSKGNIISLDDMTVNMFVDNWRQYFTDIDERYCSMFQNIKKHNSTEGIEIYFPFFFNKTSSFFDLFSNYEYVKFNKLNNNIDEYNKFISNRFNDESVDTTRPLIKPCDLYQDSLKINDFINKCRTIKADVFKIPYDSIDELIGEYKKGQLKNDYVILTSTSIQLDKFKKNIFPKPTIINKLSKMDDSFNIMLNNIIRPMFVKDMNAYIIHNENITNTKQTEKNVNEQSRHIDIDQEFKKNDYVIHDNYGLGIYDGLEIVEANNRPNEYIKIIYANNENLYVPLNNINKLTSYHKKENLINIVLDSLSSAKWNNKKIKAKKRALDHAAEILDVESRRLSSSAQSLKIESKTLKDFEKDFPYIETPDQESAFNSIRKDLSLIKPMNRVLCGDVGFGKTEVAMKSAFIAVNSNKQTVVITPSTILCDQHFDSFLKRFSNFGVNIKKLNRHVSKNTKDKIIKDFNSNNIDILITTHIVFNNEIDFNDTGLLIVDEEHKFGIKQKNFVKDKQENIHILYLSATPIPRTMNMVFSGLKDFSFLQTAPSNRLSIKSFLKIQTNQLVKEALVREKARGGQCFIVQNNIEKMTSIKKEINHLLPDYKLGIAHGQLNKKEIKHVMSDFINGRIDGLICTTIVEMGLDIPNANTIIIINSHKFGLSQLHQLRGRIGRSDKQGYCYFLIPDIEIPKISRSRLDSIIRNSNLGEGFLVAQEDLELRGGGEMLGDKQSGHVDNVGMSLYLSMLKEAINKTSSDQIVLNKKTEVNFFDSAYIKSSYLPSPIERLKIYRKIDSSSTLAEIEDIEKNLIDRCGVMPEETINLISNKKINLRIEKTGINSIKSTNKNTNFDLDKNLDNKILNKLITLITKSNDLYTLSKENKFIYKLDESDSKLRRNNVNLLLNEIL